MAVYHYPNCKFTAFSPETSDRICAYLDRRFGITIQDCCRPPYSLMTKDDTAVCVCNTCATVYSEDSKAHVKSLWEVLQDNREFPFPDLHREATTLQDYWRYYDRRAEQGAMRRILRRMNISVAELGENYERTRFCGTNLHQPLVQVNADFTPRRFVKKAQGMFVPKAEEEQKTLMRGHCSSTHTNKVVCYCVPCTRGIRAGGKQGIHLLDLLFENV